MGESGSQQAEQAETRLRLTTGVARAYIRTAALQRQLQLAKEMVDLRRILHQLTLVRFDFGLDSELSVQEAVTDLETARKRQAGVQDQYDVQRHLLARLIGQGPDAIHGVMQSSLTLRNRFLCRTTFRSGCSRIDRILPRRSIAPKRRLSASASR